MKNFQRRDFLKGSAAVSAISAFGILPSSAVAANDKINLAIIGCENRGKRIGKEALATGLVNCVALCDVSPSRTAGLKQLAPQAKIYDDFRKMFDEMDDKIDACLIGVPDHSHFPIAILAMSKGIHIYVEKPLAHTFQETELLMAAEKKHKVACQMGNQGHSGNNPLQFKAWRDAGVIKNVRRVDASMNKGRRWHPWGVVKGFPPKEAMPNDMNWDVWTGTAPMHDYNKKFDPGNWRGWHDYGDGAFGDWGPHTLDTIHEFLELGLPHEIRADTLIGQNDFIFPTASTIAFEFAERGKDLPAMSINWYDGTKNPPPRPKELAEGRNLYACGKVIYSDDLTFMGGTHGSTLRIIPETKMREISPDLPKITDKQSEHMENFLLSAMGKEKCRSSFDVAGPLTQVFALGCIAQRLGGKLLFDPKTKTITNNKRANELLTGHPPRKGWEDFYTL